MQSKAAAATSTAASPLRRFAVHTTTTCAVQAHAYGQCILATYTDVRKDSCQAEFAKFGACLREAVRVFVFRCVARGILNVSQLVLDADEAEVVNRDAGHLRPSLPANCNTSRVRLFSTRVLINPWRMQIARRSGYPSE